VQTLLSKQDFYIGSHLISPLRRDRADVAIAAVQKQAASVSIGPLAYADEPLARERVERVRDLHKALPCVGIACILT
jgi:hypothetical protein